ncbi:MAG: SDR family oxidoreductase [Candidatus Dormibacteraeota bacterium]|nr:SDR family oxidoreductase [Candidatus Dormibacteraeota bacterium]
MTQRDLRGTTAIVTGASRGFGRATATALIGAGARVVGVARDRTRLEETRGELGDAFIPVATDAADPVVAGQLLDRYHPDTVVLSAGASPLLRPLQQQTWETFGRHWDVDVRQVFNWIREALLLPLAPGSVVIAFSSGAAIAGSAVSGGYAGAKATIRFISSYGAEESKRGGLGIKVVSVLPDLTGDTEMGAPVIAAYARRAGMEAADLVAQRRWTLTAAETGKAVLELATDSGRDRDAYRITPDGLAPLPGAA